MKVIRLKAVNIKKIKEIDIQPKGNLILISGKNGQGKTSMMDCLLYALAGKREIPVKPIREGEEKAQIELDLGDIKVIRTFTQNDTYLRVLTKDGAEYPNAQSRLADLVRNIYFDPMKFAGFDPKQQKETLLNVIGVDITKEENEETRAREERTVVGRMLKQAEGELAGIQAPSKDVLSMKEVSIAQLSEQLSSLRDVSDRQKDGETYISRLTDEVSQLEEQLKKKKEYLTQAKADQKKLLTENPDVTGKMFALQQQIESAESNNQKVREAGRYLEADGRVKAHRGNYDEMTRKITNIEKEKENKLKAAKMPVDGITVTATGVAYNGIPFEQLAKSEQIRVSLALAMAQDSGLKLIRIMDGSLLDSDNLATVKEMAVARDYQVWVEVVDESGGVGFYIEDGEVKNDN